MTTYAQPAAAERLPFSVPPGATLPESECVLVQLASGGNASAFETIMRRHNRALYRTARSILGNDADAEEAVQDAYLSAHRALPTFRLQSALRTWLTRIVINHALERLRRRKRNAAMVSIDSVIDLEARFDTAHTHSSMEDSPESSAIRGETRRLLEQCIDALPSAFRIVFVMRAVEEMSVEETAACLGIPEATVRTRYFRARQLLKSSLENDGSSGPREAFAFAGGRCDRIVRRVLSRLGIAR